MVDRPEVLAIIPARGGSKGFPRKNVYDFAGFPLISFSIAAALQSKNITRTIVSTDDDEIAQVSQEYGAELPFMRPKELAQDWTLDLPVFQHALKWFAENEKYHPDLVVHLRPTTPIRPPELVDSSIQMLLNDNEADSVRGVVPAGENPYKMWRINQARGQMIPLMEIPQITEPYNTPRQQLPKVYWQTGHIDVIRSNVIMQKNSMSGWPILPYFVDPRYTVDIDNLETLKRAEEMVLYERMEMVHPKVRRRSMPEQIKLLVLDFDGVMTDDRVWVNERGEEMIAANRGDGLGLEALQRGGVEVVVISKERSTVVSARCAKLNLPVIQGVDNKPVVLKNYLAEKRIDPGQVVYLGNDINDVSCFPIVAYAAVVADAHPVAYRLADRILTKKGGYGAVREICDLILSKKKIK